MEKGRSFVLECLRVLPHDSHGTAFKPLCLGLLRGMRVCEGGGGAGLTYLLGKTMHI